VTAPALLLASIDRSMPSSRASFCGMDVRCRRGRYIQMRGMHSKGKRESCAPRPGVPTSRPGPPA